MPAMSRIYLATSNPGKVREFREAAQALTVALDPLPGMAGLTPAIENGATFEENARIKAEYYSRFAPGELVLAEDSGLAVDALKGAPGVHSARYAAVLQSGVASDQNSDDQANNAALISQLERLAAAMRIQESMCVLSPWRVMAKRWPHSPEKPPENSALSREARRGLDMIRCFTSLPWARRLPSCHWNKSASTAIAARRFAASWIGI